MTKDNLQPLRLVNGKFMRGNVEEKPEIGNVEQITCLQKYIRDQETYEHKAKTTGIDVRIRINERWEKYYSELRFKCICGKEVVERDCVAVIDEVEDDADIEPLDYDGEFFTCNHCHRKYQITGDKAICI